MSSKSHESVISSKESGSKKSGLKESGSKLKGKAVNTAAAPRKVRAHGSGWQYGIDCGQVADTINVKDLVSHF